MKFIKTKQLDPLFGCYVRTRGGRCACGVGVLSPVDASVLRPFRSAALVSVSAVGGRRVLTTCTYQAKATRVAQASTDPQWWGGAT